MKVTLRALPVVYACQGCAAFGNAARDAGARLERDGIAEMIWLEHAAQDEARHDVTAA